ncbi:aquaporin-like isoform X1 [Diabrotica undecimpunctata]|uniref:aquaporin-like isoform X1 n=1 Tax=Diabrotica undecimpunctata TaxID=50387 RepID=UPI003B632024
MVDRQFSQNNGVAVIETPTPEPQWVAEEEKPEMTDIGRLVQLQDEMSVLERIIMFLSEFGGTACLVFVGCLGCISANATVISFGFGFAIMMGVQIFGHISGAHINPAVTVAAATLGIFPLINVPIYIFGQLMGAITGFGLVKLLIHNSILSIAGLCSPGPTQHLTAFQLFLSEFLLTLLLVWVCCAVWDSRNATKHDSLPLRLGLAVTGLAMAGGGLSGANMNPARSFGPALLNNTWDRHWVYWLGPLLAGFVGALLYRIIFSKDAKKNETFPEGT